MVSWERNETQDDVGVGLGGVSCNITSDGLLISVKHVVVLVGFIDGQRMTWL